MCQLLPISTKYRSSTIDHQSLKINQFFILISYISNEISSKKNWISISFVPIISNLYEISTIYNWSTIFEKQPIFHTDFIHFSYISNEILSKKNFQFLRNIDHRDSIIDWSSKSFYLNRIRRFSRYEERILTRGTRTREIPRTRAKSDSTTRQHCA